MITAIPPDCLETILGLLSLRECLALGAASTLLLRDVQPELSRRKDRFFQRFFYSTLSLSPKLERVENMDPRVKDDESIRILPTVKERIDSLASNLSPNHPSYAAVTSLRKALHDEKNNDVYQNKKKKKNESFAINEHRKNTYPHKAHAQILSDAICSNPIVVSKGYVSSTQKNNLDRVLSVTLERYVGDVLCAYYFMSHSETGVVEGGPSERQWIDHILDEIKCCREDLQSCDYSGVTPEGVTPLSWYRAWIFLHSTLLRIAPLTPQQQNQLGILSDPTGLAAHKPYASSNKAMLMRGLSRITNFESLHVTYRDFGRLGPTFRGRDVIQTQTIFPVSPIAVVIAFETMSPPPYSSVDINHHPSPFLRKWTNGDDSVMQWLLQLHTESAKTRPMTVSPPLVTIRRS